MPHYAQIDANNLVLRVTYSTEDDADAYQWLIDNLGGTWIRTYYNTPPHVYAGIGYTWDEALQNFIPPLEEPEP